MPSPRIAPLPEAEWTEEQLALMAPMVERGTVSNIFRTLLRHPPAFGPFIRWASHVLSKSNTLSPRHRELAILRTAHLCGCGYVWAQHVPIGRRAGIGEEDIAHLQGGAVDAIGDPAAAAVLAACDTIHAARTLDDPAWATLREYFSEQQCMDLVFTIGQYTQLAIIANSFGVEIDPHLVGASTTVTPPGSTIVSQASPGR